MKSAERNSGARRKLRHKVKGAKRKIKRNQHMKANRFEDMQVWQKSKDGCLGIYKAFKTCKDFEFRDQIQSAAVSVMNNIAEGFERKGSKELEHFLYISKGSAGEVRSMLSLATDLGYLGSADQSKLSESYIEISRMLGGFIRSL